MLAPCAPGYEGLGRQARVRVWLVTVGEPLPLPPGARLLRTGLLADVLIRLGHHVVWWNSTFDVSAKAQRFDQDTRLLVSANYELRLLHSVGYRRNVSPRRLLEQEGVARKFRRLSRSEPRPDVILCSYPTLELCREAIQYGRSQGVPVVLDVRDLWPEAVVELAPAMLRPMARLSLRPLSSLARRLSGDATAITGVTREAVDWLLSRSGRRKTDLDRPFPPGYPESVPTPDAARDARRYWARLGITPDCDDFVVCFFGAITPSSELPTVLSAARLLHEQGYRFRFVLCGAGPKLAEWRGWSRTLDNVLLPGWVDAARIWTLMRMSQVGLACYVDNTNYRHVLSNKPVEYMSAGLPVVSSNKGALRRLLDEHDCGVNYEGTDPSALARVLADLQDDPDRVHRMSVNATHLYQREFRAEQVYEAMSRYLEHIADGAGP
jgi:glycosyltransferase involved in cell wall biosynthesis